MVKKTILFIIVSSFLSFSLSSNFRELVIKKLEDYISNHPEKIYVQTDKPYYITGEDIWYTAYLVNGITHKKTEKSKVIHVELINEQDSIISTKKLHIDDVSVAGDFKINKDLAPGNYLLRAYTNYMRNSDADYFFQKQIPIWNLKNVDSLVNLTMSNSHTSETKETQLTEKPDLHFYPESGYLINGIATKIGIKIKDKHNRNITINGLIKDSNDETITSFKTLKFGLGIISLLPDINKNYYASVDIDGRTYKYPLPKTIQKGYNISVINNGSHIILKVSTNYHIGLKNTLLIAHQRGKLIYEKLETEDKNSYFIKINTSTLLDGIANFTLFNSSGEPMCERLVFIENTNNTVKVNINLNNETPTTRDRVSMQLNLKDKGGNNISGNLSMSITNTDAIGQSSEVENIKTYLLLNSDLRGNIENPNYFFEKENDAKRRYLLDLVMLTHGWRRFIWTDLLYNNTKKPDKFKPEKGLHISGNTRNLKGHKERRQAFTRLTFLGGVPYQEHQQSSINGSFKYGPFVFNDTIPVLIEARTKGFKSDENSKNRLISIHLSPSFASSPKIIRNDVLISNLNDSHEITNYLKQARDIFKINETYAKSTRVLDEIIINAKKETKEELRDQSMSDRTDYGYATHRMDMQAFKNLSHLSVFELLRMLPGVNVSNDSISIRNQGIPLIYMDGIQVNLDDISNLTGNDIDFIDILSGADAAIFSNSGNGVIAIYLKNGASISAKNIKRKPGIIDFTAIGFYTAREFYAPEHINGFGDNLKQDIRTTLHWEPKIKLTKMINKAEVSFFTSDSKGKYTIKIEGLTDTGNPVYHMSTFEVE
ncbi:TonB-dependent receptor plug domain-containing protein [Flavivirga aquimarina]|uniref:TonB-dependent receptor plug domain-containing protein n=1 Tax=Flavivirga aquimarina TaxID=2027862 RepID=A0ABT8W5N6_9FLAO|nr:TonB-dependent receptor plug domain-containing protein [Flavivirga aquimarina]MDO5968432.1 TonB-dependent receptor plug domain-containing protein [Flavivirga aquimarina]